MALSNILEGHCIFNEGSAMKRFCLSSLFLITLLHGSSFDPTIPVLDMNDYYNPEKHAQFVEQIHDACADVGFFAVINTRIDPIILDNAYQSCFEFFNLSQAEKDCCHNPAVNGQRGYVAGETAKGASVKDFKEFYHVGKELPADQLQAAGIETNIWPESMDLKNPLIDLFKELEAYTQPLQSAMAEAIGQDPNFFAGMTSEGNSLLRALHYPAHPPANGIWGSEHTDIDLFTILPRATSEGLQVLNRAGEWIDVVTPENAIIVNCGDFLENLTNGRFHSGLHRVISKNDNHERFSIVYFVHTRTEENLNPLPSCIEYTGGVQNYANATRLELLEERLADLGLASPEAIAHLATSGLMDRLIDVGRASETALVAIKNAGLASEKVLQELDKKSS